MSSRAFPPIPNPTNTNTVKSIIAAVDFSNATPLVVETATNFAKSFGAKLLLFHVIEPEPSFVTYGFNTVEYPAMVDLREETERRATRLMGELLAKVRAGLPEATSQMTVGNPLQELLAQVKRMDADFVVVGSHGHGVLGSLLLGSVAEGLVRKATVPTLVVPAAPETT